MMVKTAIDTFAGVCVGIGVAMALVWIVELIRER